MHEQDFLLKVLPIFISTLSLIVAIIGWRYSKANIRQTIKNSYMSTLFDIDKQLINLPILWTIYDKSPFKLDEKEEDKARKRAFIYYHFNMFEITHTNYTKVLFKNSSDKEFWTSMTKYINQFFRTSTLARQLFKEEYTQELYLPNFVNFINNMITEIEKSIDQRSEINKNK